MKNKKQPELERYDYPEVVYRGTQILESRNIYFYDDLIEDAVALMYKRAEDLENPTIGLEQDRYDDGYHLEIKGFREATNQELKRLEQYRQEDQDRKLRWQEAERKQYEELKVKYEGK